MPIDNVVILGGVFVLFAILVLSSSTRFKKLKEAKDALWLRGLR